MAMRMRVDRGSDGGLQRLLEEAKRGDPDGWRRLVTVLQPFALGVRSRYGLDADDMSDVFMGTFQALYSGLARIEDAQSLPRWIAVVAGREAARIRRAKTPTSDAWDLDEILLVEDADAEALAIQADDALRVRNALAKMPEACRELLGALYAEDAEGYVEIASRLGLAVGSIGPSRARCLEKMRRRLESEGFFG